MLLTVHALGLGAVWIGAFDPLKVRKTLRLPKGLEPVVLVPVGYPAETPDPPELLPAEEVFVEV
jgi:nitroreductase